MYAADFQRRTFYPDNYEDLLTFQWRRNYHIYEDKWEILENEYDTQDIRVDWDRDDDAMSNYSWHTLTLFHCLLEHESAMKISDFYCKIETTWSRQKEAFTKFFVVT